VLHGRNAPDSFKRVAVRPADPPLLAVLDFRFLACLPLHVAWVIGAAGTQRLDVVDDVAGTGAACLSVRWARVLSDKECALVRIAFMCIGRPCDGG
jgi:hypothetical protein